MGRANLLATVANSLSLGVSRRSYTGAAAAQVVAGRSSGMTGVKREEKQTKKEIGGDASWVPDPATGYYRPPGEADVADLRRVLLNEKN